jgi:hypothetical protein
MSHILSGKTLRRVFAAHRIIYHRVPVWTVVLAIAGTVAVWMIDVHQVIIENGQEMSTNGFFSIEAKKAYHIGLIASPIIIWILAVFRR